MICVKNSFFRVLKLTTNAQGGVVLKGRAEILDFIPLGDKLTYDLAG